jgi:membrane dipeptidase
MAPKAKTACCWRQSIAMLGLLAACAKPAEPLAEHSAAPLIATATATAGAAKQPSATSAAPLTTLDAGPLLNAKAAPAFFPATDLHVDLGWQIHAKHASLADTARQASLVALQQGHVGTLIIPLFVERAHTRTPAEVRAEYNNTFRDAASAFAREGLGQIGIPFAAATPGAIRIRISFEGADGFVDAPQQAMAWLGRGACLWGLVHSHDNALGGGSQDPSGSNLGLTPVGKALATRLAQAGGILDVAHASDQTALDLLDIAQREGAPVVSTHTGMRALYNIRRNLPDAQIKRIAASGGVVGISFYVGHLTAGKQASLDDVVAHIEHLRSIGGASVLALGSDFEGGIVAPKDAPSIAALPLLVAKLRARGFADAELEGLFHGNADRVFAQAESRGCGKAH